jgi:hypothetical protein
MHFGGSLAGKVFLAADKVKFNEYPKYEPVPERTDEDCCCCCGCECTCQINILGETVPTTDYTCGFYQSFCFVKHQSVGSPVEATQVETYSEPLECGEYPEIGGINRTITKESRMESHIVSFIKVNLNKEIVWDAEAEQTDKLMTFYYRRITIELDQVCTIPNAAWQLNPTTGTPEIIDPNYEPSCIKCKLGTLNPLSGAGIKPCCTDSDSEIVTCEFSVVGGKGQIHISGTIIGLWEYEEGKCLDPALTGPTIVCEDKENNKRYYELNSHAWDDDRHGLVGCLSPAAASQGCLSGDGEILRIRRRKWRFLPTPPEYDDNDTADTPCEAYEKGNWELYPQESYDSRDFGLYDADGLFNLRYEIDSERTFDPNTGTSYILGTPVEVGGETEEYEYSSDVVFHYIPKAPECKPCKMTIDIGPDTVELMEPGCMPNGRFCYYNCVYVSEYEAVLKRVSDPLQTCLEIAGPFCPLVSTGDGIYREINTEYKGRFYISSSSQVTITSTTDSDGKVHWYADIEQIDHLIHISYGRKVYITSFGGGCYWNRCGEDVADDCAPSRANLYDVFTNPAIVGGQLSDCFFESDSINTFCGNNVITLERETKEAWGWGLASRLKATGSDPTQASDCVGPLFVIPPYKDEELFPGCRNKANPFAESILPGKVLDCLAPMQIGVLAYCPYNGYRRRVKRYELKKKSRSEDISPLINYCKEVKAGNVEWVFLEDVEDLNLPALRWKFYPADGEIGLNFNVSDSAGNHPITHTSGSGRTDAYVDGVNDGPDYFEWTSEPLTADVDFYMELGATRIVCPGFDEET